MEDLQKELKHAIKGDVHFDEITKKIYSIDASIYEVEPLGIVLPRIKSDLVNTIKIAAKYHVPVIARGAATGITGGCLGSGLIIDTSKYLNRILEINVKQGYVVCEPGVVQDDLNAALSPLGYRLGPDTSTGNRATLGGMLANNAAGARSLLYGKMVDHILAAEVLLAGGELITFSSIDQQACLEKLKENTPEGHIYREVLRLKETQGHEIEQRFPKIPRRVSGYNLDELIKPFPLNLSKLIAGSEGTLGIISEIKIAIVPKLTATALCVIHFDDMLEAMNSIQNILCFKPIALEMIDDQILTMGRQSSLMKNKLEWIYGTPRCIFAVEFQGNSVDEACTKAADFKNAMIQQRIGYAQVALTDNEKMQHVWDIRKAGLGLLLSKRNYSRAIAFIEDLSVPPSQLPSFMKKFLTYLKDKNKEAGIYGHAGSGCIHVRPYIDLRKKEDNILMHQMMLDISDMVLEHGGALSGEHGDGLVRSWLNKKMFGETIYQAFVDLKTAFDPHHLMNPGKIVDGPPLLESLRTDPLTTMTAIPTFLDFTNEGGFELAIDMCNGNGLCRKKESLMCPSFQVSNDEYDTTRARAQSLRNLIMQRLPSQELTSHEIYQVLDLCLECKGCKTECPSQVDMAKMKAEFLYHYQEKHGYSLRNKLFANVGSINYLLSCFPRFFNSMNTAWLSRKLLSWIGLTPRRTLPPLANEVFSKWYQRYSQPAGAKSVVLFNDTFTEYHEPHIGQSAVKVLNALGYYVHVLPWSCCGRPMISKGFLKQARKKASHLVKLLYPFANQKIPILGLEPSCILTLKDDFLNLVDKSIHEETRTVVEMSKTFDEFLADHLSKDSEAFKNKLDFSVKFHGHCHQKALVGTRPTLQVLTNLSRLSVSEIDSGCCGMAGSFGYEKEHYTISLKIGELRLFPAVRAADNNTMIIANGFSCRSHIAHATDKRAYHLAEICALALEGKKRL
jgi:FAD/FMN-containing dehydrogenase/Fe-S oxidoreductase